LAVTKSIYIDRADFSSEEKKGFFGIMPGQAVCLRYGPFVVLEEVVSENKVRVKVLPNYAEKVKGVIHWVSKENSIPAIVN
jgi:hypothetical protein